MDFEWTGAEWIAAILMIWLALAVGVLVGWCARVSFERHHRDSTPVPPKQTSPSPTPQTSKIDFSAPPPRPVSTGHPLRRASDHPGGGEPEIRPGGRRRSDGPPMTRAEARRLRESGYPEQQDGPATSR